MTVLGQLPGFGLQLGGCSTCNVEIGTVTLRDILSFKVNEKKIGPVYYSATVIRYEICILFSKLSPLNCDNEHCLTSLAKKCKYSGIPIFSDQFPAKFISFRKLTQL